jgi:hypothetical protein
VFTPGIHFHGSATHLKGKEAKLGFFVRNILYGILSLSTEQVLKLKMLFASSENCMNMHGSGLHF